MVAKINVGSSLFGALAYNQNKVDEEQGKVLFSNRMFESEDGNFNIQRCMESFEMQLPQDIKTEKPIIHISLNPHPDDRLSDELLSKIAQEYMEKLGYGNQPYMVYKHEDIDRHHLHIVSLRVDENGKKLNDKFEHRRSKDITRELEEKYGLHPAEKKQQQEHYQFQKLDYAAGDVKHQLSNTVKGVVNTYQFQSIGELNTLLSLYNVRAEEVKGEVRGKAYNGIVYSATDDKGEKLGNPIKSSRLGKWIGYEALERRIGQAATKWKDGKLKANIKGRVSEALKASGSKEQFEKNLKDKGIEVVFRQNPEGRIYGATFIDHENKAVLNGSRLGKEFSANVFNDLFREFHANEGHTKQAVPKEPFIPSAEPFVPSERQSENGKSIIGSLFSILPDGSDSSAGNDKTPPTPKKKKKRRYGRQM
ncbi:conjugal transfer protein MobB [Parabacteroides sp. Marseille-P3160]|uniref:conjugal transfer protein MobB n=1 Tax=Parabacteroides sp. Marseille-P3160 TaxID=1917887 RepID=UPI0009BC5DBE|nr:conjugal transfer protein MobB [Parabacteroides sp. Marseille-P3160]